MWDSIPGSRVPDVHTDAHREEGVVIVRRVLTDVHDDGRLVVGRRVQLQRLTWDHGRQGGQEFVVDHRLGFGRRLPPDWW